MGLFSFFNLFGEVLYCLFVWTMANIPAIFNLPKKYCLMWWLHSLKWLSYHWCYLLFEVNMTTQLLPVVWKTTCHVPNLCPWMTGLHNNNVYLIYFLCFYRYLPFSLNFYHFWWVWNATHLNRNLFRSHFLISQYVLYANKIYLIQICSSYFSQMEVGFDTTSESYLWSLEALVWAANANFLISFHYFIALFYL